MHLSSCMRDKEERGKQSTKKGGGFFSLMTPHAIFSGEKCGKMQGFFPVWPWVSSFPPEKGKESAAVASKTCVFPLFVGLVGNKSRLCSMTCGIYRRRLERKSQDPIPKEIVGGRWGGKLNINLAEKDITSPLPLPQQEQLLPLF